MTSEELRREMISRAPSLKLVLGPDGLTASFDRDFLRCFDYLLDEYKQRLLADRDKTGSAKHWKAP